MIQILHIFIRDDTPKIQEYPLILHKNRGIEERRRELLSFKNPWAPLDYHLLSPPATTQPPSLNHHWSTPPNYHPNNIIRSPSTIAPPLSINHHWPLLSFYSKSLCCTSTSYLQTITQLLPLNHHHSIVTTKPPSLVVATILVTSCCHLAIIQSSSLNHR